MAQMAGAMRLARAIAAGMIGFPASIRPSQS